MKDVFIPNRPKVSPQDYPNLPFIGMEHITAHTMKLLGTEIAAKMKSNAVHFYPMDVLYGRLRPYLNKVFRPEFEGLCSAEFIVFPANQEIYPKFLQYFLNSYEFVSFSSQQNEGDRPRVSFDVIGNYCFSLPPLAEQYRIVEKIEELFSDLDKGIESLKTTEQQLKIYRQAVLKWAFEGKLTAKWREEKKHKGELKSAEELLDQIKAEREKRDRTQLQEWNEAVKTWEANGKQGKKPGKPKKAKDVKALSEAEVTKLQKLPEGWCWVNLADVTDKITDGEHFRPKTTNNGVYFLSAKDIRENEVSFAEPLFISQETAEKAWSRCNPEKGDVLIVSRGATVGRMCVVKTNERFCLLGSVILLKVNKHIDSYFLTYILKSPSSHQKIIGVSGSTAQQAIYLRDIQDITLPLCSTEEQHQIVQEIEFRLSICDRLEATITENLTRAEALRQSILKQAFEGKLVPQDPNDEPAEKLIERIRYEKLHGNDGKQIKYGANRIRVYTNKVRLRGLICE